MYVGIKCQTLLSNPFYKKIPAKCSKLIQIKTTSIADLDIMGTYFLRISSRTSVGEGPVGFAPEEERCKYEQY